MAVASPGTEFVALVGALGLALSAVALLLFRRGRASLRSMQSPTGYGLTVRFIEGGIAAWMVAWTAFVLLVVREGPAAVLSPGPGLQWLFFGAAGVGSGCVALGLIAIVVEATVVIIGRLEER